MRKYKSFVVYLLIICITLTACSGSTNPPKQDKAVTTEAEETGAPAAELAADSVRNAQGNQDERGDLGINEEEDDADASASAGTSKDGGSPTVVSPGTVDKEPEPEQEVTTTEEGKYAYNVGDTVVYTEHPIERWMTPDPQVDGAYDLDLRQMLEDLWCEDGGNVVDPGTKVPRLDFIKDGEALGGVFFEVPDAGFQYYYHSFTLTSTIDGELYSTSVTMYDWKRGVDDPYILTDYYRAIPIELAVMLLLGAERMAEEPDRFALDDINPGPNFQID